MFTDLQESETHYEESTAIQALTQEEKQDTVPHKKEQIRQLRNGKATGEDRIGAELLEFEGK